MRFWSDWWVGNMLSEGFPRLFLAIENKQSLVCELRVVPEGVWKWRCKLRRELFQWECQLVAELEEVLLGSELNKVRKMDIWVWKAESTGQYSVKSAYKELTHNANSTRYHFLFRSIWSKFIP